MDVSNAGAASSAIVWVVGDIEKSDALGQFAGFPDLLIKILNDRNVKCRRA